MAASASSQAAAVTSRKRKARRRRQDKPALTARLVLNDHVKGDIGILSEDLFSSLFPHLALGRLSQDDMCTNGASC
jgi:peroxin-6